MADNSISTQLSMPWFPQGEALATLYGRAYDASQVEIPYYQGLGFTELAPQTELAMGLQQQRALAGSPYEMANQQYLTGALGQGQVDLSGAAAAAQYGMGQGLLGYDPLVRTAQGQMLGSNPFLDAQYGAAADAMTRQFEQSVTPGINSTFGGAGRTGSGAHQQAMANAQNELGSSLGNLASNMYGNAYQQERGLQQQAAGQLAGLSNQQVGALGDLYGGISEDRARAAAYVPQTAQMEYGNIDRLAGVGDVMRMQGQQYLSDDMARYDYYSQMPLRNLQFYSGMIQPGAGGQSTISSTPDNSPGKGARAAQGALGGALAGAGAGAVAGPWGALIGGGVGAIGGLLGGLYG